MEAKDTVLGIKERKEAWSKPIKGITNGHELFLIMEEDKAGESLCLSQAETTWQKAEEHFGKQNAVAFSSGVQSGKIQGKQVGMREVAELIDKTGLIEHTTSPLHEIGATILSCPACCWYAFKKERGL